jgi:FMN phosphatase YigB (HAD superfamily)
VTITPPSIDIFIDLDRTSFETDPVNPPGRPHKDAEEVIPRLKHTHGCELYLVSKRNTPDLQEQKIALCDFRDCFSNVYLVDTLEHKYRILKGHVDRATGLHRLFFTVDDLCKGMIKFGNQLGMWSVRVLRGPHSIDVPSDEWEVPKSSVPDLYGLEEIILQVRSEYVAQLNGYGTISK